jgi:hypothetical protein
MPTARLEQQEPGRNQQRLFIKIERARLELHGELLWRRQVSLQECNPPGSPRGEPCTSEIQWGNLERKDFESRGPGNVPDLKAQPPRRSVLLDPPQVSTRPTTNDHATRDFARPGHRQHRCSRGGAHVQHRRRRKHRWIPSSQRERAVEGE